MDMLLSVGVAESNKSETILHRHIVQINNGQLNINVQLEFR